MVGASGMWMTLQYPNPSEVTGLYNSGSRGGTAFYNRRISASQYAGVTYQYADTLTHPANASSETVTQGISAFYTIYPMSTLSVSVSGGPQHYQVAQTALPTLSSWGPSVTTSMGWQGRYATFAASYSQSVTGGGGLLGAYHSKSANGAVRLKLSRTWTIGASASYSINKSVTPLLLGGIQGGHTVSGTIRVEHPVGKQLSLSFEYDRLHESYGGIPSISANPNSNRETIALSWQFMRPLGK